VNISCFFNLFTDRNNDHMIVFVFFYQISWSFNTIRDYYKNSANYRQIKNNLISSTNLTIILILKKFRATHCLVDARADAYLKMAARSPRGRRSSESSRAEARRAERRGECHSCSRFECVRDGGTMVARRGDLPFLATVTVVTAAVIAEGGCAL